MAEIPQVAWSTLGDDPENPIPASTFPSLNIDHVRTNNVVPVNSPARLEQHGPMMESLKTIGHAIKDGKTYSIEHSSTKNHTQEHFKTHDDEAGSTYMRHMTTEGAISCAVKSGGYSDLVKKMKSPSAAKSSLASWKKQGKEGLPPQHMSFSAPTVRKVKGRPHLCISATLDKAYPNFHILCSYQYLKHQETYETSKHGKPTADWKRVQVAFATFQTREHSWAIALEHPDRNEFRPPLGIKAVLGEEEYARLEDGATTAPVRGHPGDAFTGVNVSRKITVPAEYDLGRLYVETDGYYQVDLYIPQGPF